MKRLRLLCALLAALCLLAWAPALAETQDLAASREGDAIVYDADADLPEQPQRRAIVGDPDIETPEPPQCFYVLDEADLLSEETERTLFFTSQAAYVVYDSQLVVVTVNSLDGEAIDRYAYALYNHWGIGSAYRNHGMLLLMSAQDHDYCVIEGAKQQMTAAVERMLLARDELFEAGEYDRFALELVNGYLQEQFKASENSPQAVDFASYEAYASALSEAQSPFFAGVSQAEEAWVADGADWSALTAEAGGGKAADWAITRADIQQTTYENLEQEAAQQSKDRERARRKAAWKRVTGNGRWIIILLVVILIIIDGFNGWQITPALIRFLIDLLSFFGGSGGSGGGRSSGGGGGYTSGGGGHSSGGGAGRGR